MATITAADTGATGRKTAHRVRRDVQGLRALAVALVLIYHLAPHGLPGGYVGVDVFFVISGFLITGQLLREAEGAGRVDLPRFWARRARRLLPAALLVLAVTLLAARFFAPAALVPSFFQQIAASAGYVENWVLAAQSVDYSAASADVSPVQHYWSLSVEEQFYIVWPLIAVLALALAGRTAARRGSAIRPRTAFAALMAIVAGASLWLSVARTAADPAPAYFATTTRAWEFAAGGLLAWGASAGLRPLERLRGGFRAALAWAGLGGIALSALILSDATPFPGTAALLPVLSTLCVIAASEPSARWSPQGLLSTRPVQWLGDVSYGVYLWHFPLIVLLPYVLGRPASWIEACAIAAVTLLAAGASKRFVEDPFRSGFTRSWSSRRTLAVTAAGMALVLGASLGGAALAGRGVVTDQERISAMIEQPGSCLGASALEADSGCQPAPEQTPIPEPALAAQLPETCLADIEGDELQVCEYGAPAASAKRTIALVGDSHAEQWLIPLERMAKRNDWRLVVMTKGSCPFLAAERDYYTAPDAKNVELRKGCASWNAQALEALRERPEIDAVVTSGRSTNRIVPAAGKSWLATAVAGYEQRWAELPDSVKRVVAIRDTPEMRKDVMDCVEQHGSGAASACAATGSEAMHEDPIAEAVAASPGTALVDMSDYFSVGGEYPPVLGGVLAFRDSNHLSWAYVETLTDQLSKRVKEALSQ